MLLNKTKKLGMVYITVVAIIIGLLFSTLYLHAAEPVGTATVTADSLNVRSGPGKDYEAKGKLYSGNVVDVLSVEGQWLEISYNDSNGYISIDYAEYEPSEEIIEDEEEEVQNEPADEDTQEVEDESTLDYKVFFGLIGAIAVLMIIILITIKSIKNSDEDDYDEDDDEDDEEEYEDDEEEYEDEEDDYEEDEDDDEYEYVVVKRPKQQTASNKPRPKSSDDFLIDIDPKYFE